METMNRTARWLCANPSVRATLVNHICHKLVPSDRMGLVEDHVQGFLTNLIAADRLASPKGEGREVNHQALQVWAYQSACTELRRWGADASTRASRGAKTSREIQGGAAWKVRLCPRPATVTNHTEPVNTNVVFQFDREEPTPEVDYCDPLIPSTLDTLCRETQAGFVVRVLRTTEHANCIPVLVGVLQGQDLTDLCTLHTVDLKQVTAAARLVGRASRTQDK
jgi:hypothetical protein